MGRLGERFARLKSRNEAALVAFLVAGDPDPENSLACMNAVVEGGADVLEVGLPFSDPLADGKVIQQGCQRALAAGVTPKQVLELVSQVRSRHAVGIVLFSCYNLLLQHGLQAFADDAVRAGADGVLVTDLPPEEGQEWWRIAQGAGLDTIFLVAPTTPPERISKIAQLSSGFIYGISRRGVTGARADLPADLPEFAARVRAATDLPLAIGFGISTPEQARQVCAVADGAVVGSALVERAGAGPEALREFVGILKAATRRPKA